MSGEGAHVGWDKDLEQQEAQCLLSAAVRLSKQDQALLVIDLESCLYSDKNVVGVQSRGVLEEGTAGMAGMCYQGSREEKDAQQELSRVSKGIWESGDLVRRPEVEVNRCS